MWEALCLEREECEAACASLEECISFDMHKTKARCWLNMNCTQCIGCEDEDISHMVGTDVQSKWVSPTPRNPIHLDIIEGGTYRA